MPLTWHQFIALTEADGMHATDPVTVIEWHETGDDTSLVQVHREPLGEVHIKVRSGKLVAEPASVPTPSPTPTSPTGRPAPSEPAPEREA